MNQFTKNVLETVLNAELSEHLGHEHGGIPIELGMRNGMRTKTVLTGIGPVEIGVSRDREGSFGLVVVSKCKRRLDGMLSLTVCGWMIGEIAAHFDEVCGAKVSEDTISRISEKVSGGFAEWASRLLGPLYLVFFVGVIVVRVRGGQVRNVPFYVVMGVTVNGERDILGIWAGDGGEGARFWLQVFTELENRGVEDVLIAVCDGLKSLPEVINTTWEQTVVQQCIVQFWWTSWAEFVPFLDYDVEIRWVICTTNAIESITTRYRRAVRARGHFPNEAAVLKCLYLVTRSLGGGRAHWVMR